jgi:hypothetical protein
MPAHTHLLTPDDFKADEFLPGLATSEGRERLCDFIGRYEPRYFQQALGYAFYTLLKETLAEVTEQAPLPERWKLLIEGGEWVDVAGQRHHFEGLKRAATGYVYYWTVRDTVTETTANGEMLHSPKDKKVVSPALKLARAMNESVELTAWVWFHLLWSVDSEGARLFPEWDMNYPRITDLAYIDPML